MVSDRLRMSLLPALQALLENASVTRAAETMHVTQSTMSRTLGQLRSILNDPILVREGNRIFLSEKARELQPMVDKLVADADYVFDSQVFQSETSQHHFRITASSIFQDYFLVRILAKIRAKAPGMTFSLITNNNQALQDMENGEIDLGFMQFVESTPGWLRETNVIEDKLYFLFHKDHPMVEESITTFSQLDDYPYVGGKSPMHETSTADLLRSKSRSMSNPWMMLQSFHAIRTALEFSDAYTITNHLSCPELANDSEFVMRAIPVELPSSIFKMVWPEHWEFSAAHQWLRKQMEHHLKQFYRNAGKDILLID